MGDWWTGFFKFIRACSILDVELVNLVVANPAPYCLRGRESSSFGTTYCSTIESDGLPKLGRVDSFGLQIFASPLTAIVELVHEDLEGCIYGSVCRGVD
ncbi:hypothetical protein V6N13_061889 [Hibiscus sabdariffa]|uniref:Uncharacterized protein n=2 Tax=Hibiscus sabdariffa TaxID=183260 RepID=A0ABR2BQP8_9ROSI